MINFQFFYCQSNLTSKFHLMQEEEECVTAETSNKINKPELINSLSMRYLPIIAAPLTGGGICNIKRTLGCC